MNTALKLYWGPNRGDNFTTGTAQGEQDALAAGYTFIRVEGYVHTNQQPNTVPLKLYWNPARGDNFATATAQGEQAALGAGYQFIRLEGYVYPSPQPNMVPLKLYWSPEREDNFTTATAQGEQAAVGAGYHFIREEGYVASSPAERVIIGNSEMDFGGGKHGRSNAVLDSSGLLTVTTQTWTNSPFQGFTMGVKVWGLDQNSRTRFETTGGPGPYGVDGHSVPFGSASSRMETYTQQLNPAEAANVTDLRVALFHAPKWRIVAIINQTADVVREFTDAINEFCRKNPDVCALVKEGVRR